MNDIKAKLDKYVKDYLVGNSDFIDMFGTMVDVDDVNHVIDIGSSILMTKFPELGGYKGGSFVQAVVDNDLERAFGGAAKLNQLGEGV